MTYGQVKRAALRLINAGTIGGVEIPPSYNGQADLLKAIPTLADDAVMQIATTVRKIPAAVCLDALDHSEQGGWTAYALPADCWRVKSGGLLRPDERGRCGGCRLLGRQLLLPAGEHGLWLEYWRYPVSLGSDPDDDAPLDNSPDTHTAIPYFIAGQLVLYDDAYRYAALHNEWESRLSRLSEAAFAEEGCVRDAYAGFDCGELW
ncbi:MAG: hypothetical protein IK149_03255 [Oscillospiraceae bacterium]|nr:hypothetical protein [Oscillospiraceae bacterium]